jgi:CRP-like cAMP-binding protein
MFADEIIRLLVKIEILSKYSVRERLITYLATMSRKRGSMTFTLDMNITDFANYLCVSREYLSRHFNRLIDEGLLKYEEKTVTLLSDEISRKYDEIEMK